MSDSRYQKINESDEIDLIELIKNLWKKKLWIILSAFVCTAIAAGYAFTVKEQWTSKSVVIPPKVANLGDYLSFRSEYASILDIKDFSQDKVSENVFNDFKTALFSRSLKEAFFSQSKWFNTYADKNANSEETKHKLLSNLVDKNLIVTVPDPKKDPNAIGVNVSFSAETPKEAQDVLSAYIQFVNQWVVIQNKKDFLADISVVRGSLEIQKNKIKQDAENARQIQLENLTTALNIAKSAGIKDYSKSLSGNISLLEVSLGDTRVPSTDSKLSDGTYLFMLGEQYLQAQVNTLKNASLVYPLNYYNIEKQANLLSALEKKVEKEGAVSGYYYLSEPDYPVQRDWPKRLILLIVGFVFGVVLSSLIILARDVFSNKA
ncbi:LPS O-antigen chain length determinant protein WzzB [Haemophilus parainfluenzae]|uniref:LPS O-antigen chain length determinant protein WzzB n=1 Tax=Haemophilus parainfluenzae TaxID=729 RepID=UPI0018A64F64|nr:Wzz/FepE/Etk N-terminal domain-containing protein [Haemophilus parainfluenzae]QOR11902.1 LPS O-antigen chain length determinant protein WzzB [Haemophilus parainfluenzae]